MKKTIFIAATCICAFTFNSVHSQNWKVTGNTGITPLTEFLGTTDNVSLNFRTNNLQRLTILNTGNVGIGTTTPAARLDVNGQLRITDGTQGIGKVLTTDANGLASWQTPISGFPNGGAVGSTPYWNGASWISTSNNIYNNGGNVGIGTATPSSKLEINGQIKIVDGTQGGGKILTSDATGLASWQTPANAFPDGWSRLGNSGTIDGTHFIGTTDNVPLNFRVNNQKAGRIDPNLNNTFLGYMSGNAITTGHSNTAFGSKALANNTDGEGNVAIGEESLYTNNEGYHNVVIGSFSMNKNTEGYQNVSIGNRSLFKNTSGFRNAAVGFYSLNENTSGEYNCAFGFFALVSNSVGSHNIAMGNSALIANTTGHYNTGIGDGALTNNFSAQYNTGVGYHAGFNFHHGYNNVFLGANTNTDADDYYNVIACGQGTIVLNPSTARFGNEATVSYGGWANWTNVSDGRYKNNIQENVPGLEFIDKLRPVTYTLDATGLDAFMHKNVKDEMSAEGKAVHQKALQEKEKITYTGFIAQEVEASAKELGFDFSGVEAAKSENDVYGLRYAEFVVPLVKAVQELNEQNTNLKSEVENLKNEIESLKVAVGITREAKGTEQSAILYQNSPNPFSEKTTIKYFIPESAPHAEIKIYDSNGKDQRSFLISEKGNGQIEINANSLPAGIYNYILIVDGKAAGQRQMILTK